MDDRRREPPRRTSRLAGSQPRPSVATAPLRGQPRRRRPVARGVLRPTDRLTVRMTEIPPLTREDQPADKHPANDLREPARRTARTPNTAPSDNRNPRTPRTLMPRTVVQPPPARELGSRPRRLTLARLRTELRSRSPSNIRTPTRSTRTRLRLEARPAAPRRARRTLRLVDRAPARDAPQLTIARHRKPPATPHARLHHGHRTSGRDFETSAGCRGVVRFT
jgi:hypothetical protein